MESDRFDTHDLSTRRPSPAEWGELAEAHSSAAIEALRPLIEGDGRVDLTARTLAVRAAVNDEAAVALLGELARRGFVIEESRWECGCCEGQLERAEADDEVCVHCDEAFKDCPGGVVQSQHFVRPAVRGRDVAWMIVVHGMGTTGAWQEKLSWLASLTYQRSLPVFIYKYGKVRPGVFLRWRQHQLSRDLAVKLQTLASRFGTRENGHPDVLAHSFGTWLIGHVLLENPELRVGRVILAGSIIRPDFDWTKLLLRGQVEAVLNHCAAKDRWVPLAHYVIPAAGPSGVQGFVDRRVVHRVEEDFGHSSFFDMTHLETNYKKTWDLFLKRPTERLRELSSGETSHVWRPLPHVVREAMRMMLVAVFGLVAVLVVISTVIGGVTLVSWILD